PGSEPRSRRLRIGAVDVVAHNAHGMAGGNEALHDGHDGRDIAAEMGRREQEAQWLAPRHDKGLLFAASDDACVRTASTSARMICVASLGERPMSRRASFQT